MVSAGFVVVWLAGGAARTFGVGSAGMDGLDAIGRVRTSGADGIAVVAVGIVAAFLACWPLVRLAIGAWAGT